MIGLLMEEKVVNDFMVVERAFKGTKYQSVLDECIKFYNSEDGEELKKSLTKLPSSEDLFRDMLEKLSHPKPTGKPIFRTMRKIIEGKQVTIAEKLKAYFSFCTHVCIELEHGNNEFRMLLDTMYEKIGEILYGQSI